MGKPEILLTGAAGFLGAHLARRLASGHRVHANFRSGSPPLPDGVLPLPGDLAGGDVVDRLLRLRPDLVVHAAALTDADACERDRAAAWRNNVEVTRRLAEAVRPFCRRFIYVSTDLVFGGDRSLYRESDPPRPLMVYGRTKLEAEAAALEVLGSRATVARVALLYGRALSGGRASFAEKMVREALSGRRVLLFDDQFRSPLCAEDAAAGIELLLELDAPPPIVHLGGPERVSRHEIGVAAARIFGLDPTRLVPARMSDVPAAARRPVDVSLDISLARSLGFRPRGLSEGLELMRSRWLEVL
jgi:dTDP-4-dehydrorhamnose reductase